MNEDFEEIVSSMMKETSECSSAGTGTGSFLNNLENSLPTTTVATVAPVAQTTTSTSTVKLNGDHHILEHDDLIKKLSESKQSATRMEVRVKMEEIPRC